MTEVIVIVAVAVVFVTVNMSCAMHFVTIILTGFKIEASSICYSFKTGEYDAEQRQDKDWSGHERG
jgi:hypothetical protein